MLPDVFVKHLKCSKCLNQAKYGFQTLNKCSIFKQLSDIWTKSSVSWHIFFQNVNFLNQDVNRVVFYFFHSNSWGQYPHLLPAFAILFSLYIIFSYVNWAGSEGQIQSAESQKTRVPKFMLSHIISNFPKWPVRDGDPSWS